MNLSLPERGGSPDSHFSRGVESCFWFATPLPIASFPLRLDLRNSTRRDCHRYRYASAQEPQSAVNL